MLKFALIALLFAIAPINAAYSNQEPAPQSVGLYNYSTFTVGISTAISILPRNVYRAHLFVQNQGAVSVVIKPGSAPANATDGVVLIAGQIWEPSQPFVDAFYGISASSTAKIVMIEGAK